MKKTFAIMIALMMVLMSGISVFAAEDNGGTIYWNGNGSATNFTPDTNPPSGGTIYWNGDGSATNFTPDTNPPDGGTIYWVGNDSPINTSFTNNMAIVYRMQLIPHKYDLYLNI